jgi:lipopolysaccharide export system permease protein
MILRRYLATELLLPACLALGGFILVVLTKDLAGYSELVINRGAGFMRISRIISFQALTLMSQMLPFAVLIGALVGLGRMAADLEILVMAALGIEPRKLIAPVALFGAGAAALGLVLALVIAPWAHRGLNRAFLEIAEINPAAEIQPGVVSRFGDWKLEAHAVSNGGHSLERVVLWIPSIGETVFAETAEVAPNEKGELEIAFYNGALLLNAQESARSIRFEEMRAALPRANEFGQPALDDRLAGMSLADLLRAARDDAGGKQTSEARSELHRRCVLPIAGALFAALALPLALARGRGSRSDGAMLGLAVTIAYYGLIQLAEGISQRAPELAVLATWLPNAVLAVSTIALYQRLARPWPAEKRIASSVFRKRLAALGRRKSDLAVQAKQWALPRYVAGRFLQLAFLSFAVLVAAYLLVDILERLQWFARHAATFDEILRFYSMRIPLLVSRVVPMGLLVAMALTISQLTTEGELIGMRSCGISAPRALQPTLLVCLVMTPLSFLLNDQIVPRTNELADLIKQRDIKGIGAERSAVWGANGSIVYQLASLDTSLGMADEIVVYQLGLDGLPESRIDAGSARYVGDGKWRLRNATAVEIREDGRPQRVPPAVYAGLGDVPSDEVDLKSFSVEEVRELIREFASTGDSTTTFEVALHLKLSTPLACLLLPTLLMAFAVAGPPFPSSALTLVFAGALAVGYTLAAGAFASFGRAGVLPPWLGGWAPILIASVCLCWLSWRTRMAQRGTRV